ncbi:hypothetical protein [Burkholderia ubonensis]|uniref:hypothetical protein n=1 Tax=Burkholderia ubonensis TaxID=101571 RepID=UPI0012F90E5E|nr:hypothetical protein [Burkholderia ubonensis]
MAILGNKRNVGTARHNGAITTPSRRAGDRLFWHDGGRESGAIFALAHAEMRGGAARAGSAVQPLPQRGGGELVSHGVDISLYIEGAIARGRSLSRNRRRA